MTSPGITIEPAIPILRIFDVELALAFYRDFLGMAVDWEHRFDDGMPLYCQVSRGALVLHLTEHVGDTTPGTRIFIRVKGVRDLHAELAGKPYQLMRPGIESRDWGDEMTLTDPFGNRLTFC